jgi:hypothetical protein
MKVTVTNIQRHLTDILPFCFQVIQERKLQRQLSENSVTEKSETGTVIRLSFVDVIKDAMTQ